MTILGIAEVVGDASVGYAFPLINGKLVPVELVRGERYDPDSSEPQRYEWRPVLIDYDVWFFHGHAVSVKETTGISEDEMKLRVKHAVFSKLEDFQRVAREVEAFENTGRAADAGRERIPESVRLFVWQRDQGRCVRCGAREKLEFDHIIPVAMGGASTERNVQLLCEACNRAKGATI